MPMKSMKANNEGVMLHYLDSATSSSLVPVLICPGLSETAEEYTDLIEYLSPRRCVVLSFRGRGQSDTPASGYNLADHVADIECVVKAADLNIRPDAVWGIQRESEQVYFDFRLNKRLLVLMGKMEGSLLNDEALEPYRRISSDVTVVGFRSSGHDIRNTEKELLYRTIGEFLNLT